MAILSNSWTQHLKSRAGNDEANKNMKAFSEAFAPARCCVFSILMFGEEAVCPDGRIVPAVFRVRPISILISCTRERMF